MKVFVLFAIVAALIWAYVGDKLDFLRSSDLVKIGVYEIDGGFTVYEEPKSIQRTGDKVQMRRITDYVIPQSISGITFLSLVSLKEFDCGARMSRSIGLTSYSANMAKGEVRHTDSTMDEWKPVKTGGGSEKALQIACNSK